MEETREQQMEEKGKMNRQDEYDKKMDEWKRAVDYANTHAEDVRKYGDDYVAIQHGIGIVGHNSNKFELARQMRKEFPNEVVLITTYQQIVNPRVVEMDSPELEEIVGENTK